MCINNKYDYLGFIPRDGAPDEYIYCEDITSKNKKMEKRFEKFPTPVLNQTVREVTE